MKIEVKRDLCIGAANCIAVAPDAFELDSENKAVLKKEWEKVAGDILLESAKSCPTQAIFVYDDENKQIFP
ncbi:MAG: ferredoxin [Patescibacteria group bacterium]